MKKTDYVGHQKIIIKKTTQRKENLTKCLMIKISNKHTRPNKRRKLKQHNQAYNIF